MDEEIILLDSDFTDEEVQKLTGYTNFKQFDKLVDKNLTQLDSESGLISKLSEGFSNWSVTLFTSGTTGLPKKNKTFISEHHTLCKTKKHKPI